MTTTERLRELLKEYHDSGLSPRIGDLVPTMIEALPALLAVVRAAEKTVDALHESQTQYLQEALSNLEKEQRI